MKWTKSVLVFEAHLPFFDAKEGGLDKMIVCVSKPEWCHDGFEVGYAHAIADFAFSRELV
jgi:hypothetical protein